ncbi:MAG: hypothetical protein LBQ57_11275 [Spirochaetales bacterium]|jgi:hypothetical protein|nr:hypothetical protein [Spirochaetales bacterium]
METTKAIGEGLTFEKVWAAIQETDRIVKETAQQIKETDRQMKETDRQMKETDKRLEKQLGKLGNRFGEMVEYMIVPNLVAKFNELGFEFEKTHRDKKIADREHNIFTEVDAFLENGDKVMVVEIKTKPNSDDINDHIERMEKLRTYADFHNDKRKYLGAIAGVVFGDSEKIYAFKKGFYVIEPSGDTFNITPPKGSYYPHEW